MSIPITARPVLSTDVPHPRFAPRQCLAEEIEDRRSEKTAVIPFLITDMVKDVLGDGRMDQPPVFQKSCRLRQGPVG